jgi:hypothetical protein
MAFALGMICGLAKEGRFSLLSGSEGYALAFLAEMIQPGTIEYITTSNKAPEEWYIKSPDAFGLNSVTNLMDGSPLYSQQNLALTQLYSALI